MPLFRSPSLWRLLRLLCVCASCTIAGLPARAQELHDQPIPFSVWLDFEALLRPDPPHVSLPIWLESLQTQRSPRTETTPEQTVYRLRLRRMGQLNREILLRLFFDDRPDASPIISGWTETGRPRYLSPTLGEGLDLPTSVALTVPVADTDYLDITVPGNGSNVRGVFLSTLGKTETTSALDFPISQETADPFGNLPQTEIPTEDKLLFGRVRALLEPKAVKLAPDEELDFTLQRQPLVAMVTFEALNVDIAYPPELSINDLPLGPARTLLPDLASPAYHGDVRPMEQDMHFRYTGWLRCQAVIRGSALIAGENHLVITVNNQGGSIAVRAVELHLKYNYHGLDYTVAH